MDYTNALAQPDPNAPIPVHPLAAGAAGGGALSGINGIVKQLLMMKMMQRPQQGLMGQAPPISPAMNASLSDNMLNTGGGMP